MNSDYISPFAELFTSQTSQSFFCDDSACEAAVPETLKRCGQFELLHSRQKLREFCREKKLPVPAFMASDRFERLSAWAIKINRFPMAIKSSQNLADGKASFLLKAFRELPEFFEQIVAYRPGDVILEEYITPKARVEVTWLNGKIRIIAQSSLEKSMQLRQAWRAFPVKLPKEIFAGINLIADQFSQLLHLNEIPLRLTFAITGRGPILLALNSGFNRPEYFSEWRQTLNLPALSDISDPESGSYCKIFSFYGFKSSDFDEDQLIKLCSSSQIKWAALADQIAVMLVSEKATTLQEDARRVEAMFKHLSG